MRKYMTITLDNGEVWGVPTEIIAKNRASHYADEFGGDIEKSLSEDTLPLFEDDNYNIQDWALNNMNWSDFDGHQVKLHDAPPTDFNFAWMNSDIGYEG